MKRLVFALPVALCTGLLSPFVLAQAGHDSAMSGMKHEAAVPSRSLRVTGFGDRAKTLTPEELKAMPHVTVTVTNGHSHKQESYSGVPVKDLLSLVAAPKEAAPEAGMKPKISPRTTVIVAQGRDKFRVVLTLCDTDPGCRSGQAIVADSVDGQPLTTDGVFKLILTEDKMPGRWVRNLDALTEKNIEPTM